MIHMDKSSLEQLANFIAVRVAIELSKRTVSNGPQSPVGALSKADAAAYLGVSTRTIENYIAAGELNPAKQGAKVTLRIGDLEALLERKQKT